MMIKNRLEWGSLIFVFNISFCVILQIETQLAEYHKLARKLKLIPKGAENSKGYDFEIKFNPEAGANCLVKYRAQVYVSLIMNTSKGF